MIQISAIMTAHREGLLAGPSIASFNEAILAARNRGLVVEAIVILDRSDDLTRSIFDACRVDGYQLFMTDSGDPALSRNFGASVAKGKFISFLDADDLWSQNWLVESFKFCSVLERATICHSECNVIFGDEKHIWFHMDSEDEDFEPDFLRVSNYWDSMSFGKREIFVRYPFIKNDVSAGFGHEDWHWNCVTLAEGISHRPVPGTIHAKRRRGGSQSARCAQNDVVIWPNKMSSYDWRIPDAAAAKNDWEQIAGEKPVTRRTRKVPQARRKSSVA
jgi:glycosyltransferase involved in cell wall biosynthesis